MKNIVYLSEVLRVTDTKTNKTRYYFKKCDVYQRVSKLDHDKRFDEADGVSSFYTKISKNHTRHYSSLIYYHEKKQLKD